jgi:hypothetical protein
MRELIIPTRFTSFVYIAIALPGYFDFTSFNTFFICLHAVSDLLNYLGKTWNKPPKSFIELRFLAKYVINSQNSKFLKSIVKKINTFTSGRAEHKWVHASAIFLFYYVA